MKISITCCIREAKLLSLFEEIRNIYDEMELMEDEDGLGEILRLKLRSYEVK